MTLQNMQELGSSTVQLLLQQAYTLNPFLPT